MDNLKIVQDIFVPFHFECSVLNSPLRKKAWPPLFETFCERCAPEEDGLDAN